MKKDMKSSMNLNIRKHITKITLLIIGLYLLLMMLYVGILTGLGTSVGALVGFALSFISLSPIVGGMISSVSMLSAFFVIDKIRSNNPSDYVDLIMTPDADSNIKEVLVTLGFSSPVANSIKIGAYFGIGVGQ